MAATPTTRYGLKKPSGTDAAAVGIINENMDTLDEIIPNIIYSATEPENPQDGDIWLKPIGG